MAAVMHMLNSTQCYMGKDGRYLMMHRVKKAVDANKDKWIGIGGKFEEGESPEDCVLREVLEETGLTLDRWAYRGLVTFVSDKWETEYMHIFTSDAFHGQLREDCDEGVLEWIGKWELLDKPIWEGDKLFLRLLEQDVPFFSLKLRYEGDSLVQAVLNGVPL